MEPSDNTKNLKLALVGLDPPIVISSFDNYTGTFVSSTSETGLREAAILNTDSKVLWAGVVRLNADQSFDLCVSPSANVAKDEVIPWKDLPPFFTVFDGGYESLGIDSVNALLDDLITFHELVKVRCHFELNGKQESITGKWGDQENLKTLSEILIDWDFKDKLVHEQLVLLEIELFETVYFVIAIHEENDNEGIVLSLTSHFYQQRNRIGRRIPIQPIEIDGLKILEVSDFGMKVSTQNIPSSETNELKVVINNYALSFGITYRKMISPEEVQMGIFIQDHSPEARKAWQGFLLGHQYPLLRIRNETHHEKSWQLLEESGYFSDPVGKEVKELKTQIINEWQLIDHFGPDYGTSVISFNEKSEQPVATIGVSRASKYTWVAQAAAMIDQPQHLRHTASVYSWRTRSILQQIDGKFHLAFFAANKPFLDRFFRKFYLKLEKDKQHLIDWNEWLTCFLPIDNHASSNKGITNDWESSFLEKNKSLAGIHPAAAKVFTRKNISIISGRPTQHIAQFLSSIWIEKNDSNTINEAINLLKTNNNKLIVLMLKDNIEVEIPGLIKTHATVHWCCERQLLPDFLCNSLKALEQMQIKYGLRNVG